MTMSFSSRSSGSEVFDSASPPYSNVTVRRAFIVWLHCGQTNKFRDVCNYYHVLEGLEDQLPPERKATSRHHEFNLFTNPPPSSKYLSAHHPSLYKQAQPNDYYIGKVEAIRNDKCVFKLDGFRDIFITQGVSRRKIIETSRLIRNFCLSHYITLTKFLVRFTEYIKRCNLPYSLQSVWWYIQGQLIKDEMIMVSNWPVSFSFLDDDEDTEVSDASMNNLNNQRRLLQSINVSPTGTHNMLIEMNNNPWRVDKNDNFSRNRLDRMNIRKDFDTQYRKPG